MKLLTNTGTDRVVDLLGPGLTAGRQLDVVSPTFSIFAFAALMEGLALLARCRLLLPPSSADLALLGSEVDRAARNQIELGPWSGPSGGTLPSRLGPYPLP